jgi:hypothetical protein
MWGITAGGALTAQVLRTRAETRYLAATSPADIADRYRKFDTWHRIRNNLFLSAAGVWAFAFADALVRWEIPLPEEGQADVRLAPAPSGFSARLTWGSDRPVFRSNYRRDSLPRGIRLSFVALRRF